MQQAWPWILSAASLFGFWIVGKKRRSGWMVSLCVEVLWAVWSVLYREWGFLASVFPFAALYIRNWWLWRDNGE
jgi:hypothetical protein